MLPKYVPPSIWNKRNNSELYIPFPNGSVFYIVGADHPDTLRGPNPRGVVLDEYGDIKPEIWSAIIQPIMMANPNAWCWFAGTPKGRNDFFTKFDYAQTSGDPDWWATILKASESGIIDQKSLEQAKKTTTQAFYKQEYECDFLDNATAFFRQLNDSTYKEPWEVDAHGDYQLGVDLAKYQDWTVITPFNLNTFRVGPQIRFNQIDYNLQKAMIETEYMRYNRGLVRPDSTGLGDPICDDLALKGIQLDPFKFTEESRKNLLNNLAILLEQKKIKLPDDPELIRELQGFQYTLGENNKVKIQSNLDHDDRVMSLALAVWGVNEPIRKVQNYFQAEPVDDPFSNSNKNFFDDPDPYEN